MSKFVAANDPETANRIVNEILAGPAPEEVAPVEDTKSTPPPGTVIELPCGLVTLDGLVREVEVRELNGFDEEALAKASASTTEYVQRLMDLAVVRIGNVENPSGSALGALTGGDVDAITLAISRVTYGDTLEAEFFCPHCRELVTTETHLVDDVPVKRLDSEADQRFTVKLRKGEADVRLPDWDTLQDAAGRGNATQAELTTVFLKHCVESINGMPVLGEDSVRRLSAADRATLIDALNDKVGGPKFSKVEKPCPECEQTIPLPLSVAALFRTQLG